MDGAANFSHSRPTSRASRSWLAACRPVQLAIALFSWAAASSSHEVFAQLPPGPASIPAVVGSTSDAQSAAAAESIELVQSPVGTLPAPVASPSPRPQFQANLVTSSATIEEALDRRGSISFRKTAISEVVFLMSDLWKINIVAGDSVGGEVSGVFHDAPLRDVLSSTLAASGFGYRQVGDSLVVLPLEQINAGDNGSAPSSASAGSATNLNLGIANLASTDIAYFTMQYTDAELLAEPLRAAMSGSTVIAVYPEENRLMIKGTPDEIRIATNAIEQLDIPRQQVRITALIYDVSLDELERLGVNWSRNIRPLADAGAEIQTFSATATVDSMMPDGSTSFALRSLSENFDAAMLLQALDQNTEAKLLANPSITVSDRHEASMQIVKRLPIIAANPVAGSNAVFAQVTFVDAGVILRVTPRISRDQTIEMNVSPEFSVKVGETNGNPIIDSRTAQTTVRVNNGSTFALGGLRQKSISETTNGVPWLKDRKYIGALFRSHQTNVTESELIVFLKPELVDAYYDNTMRERRAACVATKELDAIPFATHCPQSPYCKDPHCPYHHPRPRINGGTRELEMLGGEGFDDVWVPMSEGGFPIETIESSGVEDAIDMLPPAAQMIAPQAGAERQERDDHMARRSTAFSVATASSRIQTTSSVHSPATRATVQPASSRARATLRVSGDQPSDPSQAFPPVHVESSFRR